MDYQLTPNSPIEAHLVQGCCREADRADIVSLGLDGLRNSVAESLQGYMNTVAEEIRSSSRLLRDLADRSQVHISRVPTVLNYLNVVLPCLCKSLRDITGYYEDKTLTREIRWRKMYNKMTEEAGGLPLPQRFILYNAFLMMLLQLLTRSPDFDFNVLENLQTRILHLRELRGIPPPTVQVNPVVPYDGALTPFSREPPQHWAEKIFTQPLPSRTALERTGTSESHGPHFPWGQGNMADYKILFKRSFDDDRVSLQMLLNNADQNPYLLLRSLYAGRVWFSLRGAHELCIRRDGGALHLRRWSRSTQSSKMWAVLYFMTWEEMVLFYCTFLSLKARNTLTVQISPEEFKLHREKRLFQAQIMDDGYKHSLIVYEDQQTGGKRLHAAVWEGELKQCPVWTAFVTHQSASPTWLVPKGRHRIYLRDLQLYVFCARYRPDSMRQRRSGAFLIQFVTEQGASRFREVFYPGALAVGGGGGGEAAGNEGVEDYNEEQPDEGAGKHRDRDDRRRRSATPRLPTARSRSRPTTPRAATPGPSR